MWSKLQGYPQTGSNHQGFGYFLRNSLRIAILIDEVRLAELGFFATSRMNLERVDMLASTSSSRASQNSSSNDTLVFWPAIVTEYFVPKVRVMVIYPLWRHLGFVGHEDHITHLERSRPPGQTTNDARHESGPTNSSRRACLRRSKAGSPPL